MAALKVFRVISSAWRAAVKERQFVKRASRGEIVKVVRLYLAFRPVENANHIFPARNALPGKPKMDGLRRHAKFFRRTRRPQFFQNKKIAESHFSITTFYC